MAERIGTEVQELPDEHHLTHDQKLDDILKTKTIPQIRKLPSLRAISNNDELGLWKTLDNKRHSS